MKTVYFDNAATTPIFPSVCDYMDEINREIYGNPSGLYGEGLKSKKILNNTRQIIADSLGAMISEIYFTSGGSESDNLAIKGVLEANRSKGRHLITTAIEHHAVINTARWLSENGYRVTYIPVDKNGLVNPRDIEQAICSDTVLISVMSANNEIGTIQPVREIGKIARAHGILFHTDAVQAYTKLDINVREDCIDLLSASAHKFNGPKGVGFLYIKHGTKIVPIIHGGEQEKGLRSGTENVSAIAGMGRAVEISLKNRESWIDQEVLIRDYLLNRITNEIEGVSLNGSIDNRLPSNLNFSIEGIEGETLMISLDIKKIAVSTGSACAVKATEPSHVLKAIGINDRLANGSVRITYSGLNTLSEAEYFVDSFKETVDYLRRLPL